MSEPRSRPVIFSAPMVRAILDGRKTQTRRIVKQLIGATAVEDVYHRPDGRFIGLHLPVGAGVGITQPFPCPYGVPGDRLWVRENWRPLMDYLSECTGPKDIRYAASVSEAEWAISKWRPSIHMPRWASRLSLLVTDVRVQRLQQISEEDARAEGVLYVPGEGNITPQALQADPGYSNYLNCRLGFEELWGRINGADSWAQNPWVWVVSFERVNEQRAAA